MSYIIVLLMFFAAAVSLILAFHSYKRRLLSRHAWDSKIRVARIEQEITRKAPDSSSELIVTTLAGLVSDNSRLRAIHAMANSGRGSVADESISLDNYVLKACLLYTSPSPRD